MVVGAAKRAGANEFARLHRAFVQHLTMAVGFAWFASLYAALHAPWVRNIRGLMDPTGRIESTPSYLFLLPTLMTAALLVAAAKPDLLRRSQMLKSAAAEFAFAGAVAFAVFCMAIHRAVAAYMLG